MPSVSQAQSPSLLRELRLWLAVVVFGWAVELIGDDISDDGLRAIVKLAQELQKRP
jgi:hypothetical protein